MRSAERERDRERDSHEAGRGEPPQLFLSWSNGRPISRRRSLTARCCNIHDPVSLWLRSPHRYTSQLVAVLTGETPLWRKQTPRKLRILSLVAFRLLRGEKLDIGRFPKSAAEHTLLSPHPPPRPRPPHGRLTGPSADRRRYE